MIALLAMVVTLATRASAESHVMCAAVYDPVCGQNGQTYGSACNAAIVHVQIAHQGACISIPLPRPTAPVAPGPTTQRPRCVCLSMLVMLVCGEDGKTHTSPCRARCAGNTNFTTGRCPVPLN
ncbi:hypothetical protein BV898_03144 [Hypsibius exemplaris]|uniref:Kazal-like domain-containing protein n=1 Tax=Hypsibius exemplaris TaxID=2072580 RepID=A0A1W0X6E6_HYPEX|nr:hypothetical protein BV898_03144 [Hypsibius exemplaris]